MRRHIALLPLLFALAFVPGLAFAKSYEMPQVDISAQVSDSGALSVQESREFDLDGSFSCIWWEFGKIPAGSDILFENVSLTLDGKTVPLPSTPFETKWRNAGGPGRFCYSVDEAQDAVYVFFKASDCTMTVDLDYTISAFAQVYSDGAEVYWQFVGDGWGEDAENIACNIHLPVPGDADGTSSGSGIAAGEDVYLWGHGPLSGNAQLEDNGTVNYTIPHLPAGEFAEARIIFPASWLDTGSLSPSQIHSGAILPTALSEEEQWANEANMSRVGLIAVAVIPFVIALALIAWALVMLKRHGKEYKPSFTGEYWRDAPDPDAEPANIGRLWRWNKESPDDFTATVILLAHKGTIRIDQLSSHNQKKPDYILTLDENQAAKLTSDIDIKCMQLLFDTIGSEMQNTGSGVKSVLFSDIKKFGKKNPQKLVDEMSAWQSALSVSTDRLGYFEEKGEALKVVMRTLAVIVICAGFLAMTFFENLFPAIAAAIAAVALFVIAHFMSRMTHHGAEVYAKAKALKRWLEDFTALDERPPMDVKVWGEFMIYAYLFGIAKEVLAELKVKVPEVFQGDDVGLGGTYMPWWFWYSTSMGGVDAGQSIASAFDKTLSNTLSSAQTALAATSGGSGGFSSGGGFGGGFSGGGGGGFGGGGGGAR